MHLNPAAHPHPLRSPWQWPVLVLVLLGVLAGGWWAADWRGGLVDRQLRAQLLMQAETIAATIDHETVQALSFTESDRDHPRFQRLRDQMMAYARAMNHRSLYSMALRDGQVVFGPESLDEDDPWASEPGMVYEQPTRELLDGFRTGIAFTEGPVTDEYGSFVSALAPVIDPHTSEVLLMVGLDVDASQWHGNIMRVRLIPLLFTLVLVLILLGGGIVLHVRSRLEGSPRRRLRHAEAALTAVFGLALTTTVALLTHDAEVRTRQMLFLELANGRAALARDSVQAIATRQLASFARFFEADNEVTRAEFRHFTGTFNRDAELETIVWVPAYPDHYPLRYVEPDHAELSGYDLANDPLHLAALEEAARSGLVTVTEGALPGARTEPGNVLRVVQPVYSVGAGQSERELRGFLLAILAPDALVRRITRTSEQQLAVIEADLQRLEIDGPALPASCASAILMETGARNRTCEGYADMVGIFPLFQFGTSFALTIRPGPAFMALHFDRTGRTSAVAGLLLTLLATLLVGFLSNRRSELEQQVLARTAALRDSEALLRGSQERLQLALSGANLGLWDWHFPSGRVIYNHRLAEMLGYRLEEIEPRASSWEKMVHPEDWPGVWARFEAHLRGEIPSFESEHRLRHKDGHWVWVLDRGMIMERAADGTPIRAAGTHLDINRRKSAEAELERLASTDPLTGLPNRRQFFARLNYELTRLDRLEGPVALLMIDLDHFKRINDNHGHAAGDSALRHFADQLRAAVRKTDSIGRLGGEEFALLLPGSDRNGALLLVQRLAEQLRQTPPQHGDAPLAVTFSTGLTLLKHSDRSPDHPLARADQALYRAKALGRDRVEFQD